MKILAVADIHGNLRALEALLAWERLSDYDRLISLGDQVNFGPKPRETMALLSQNGFEMVLGNHEERFGHLNEPAFAGYGWNMLRWTWDQLGNQFPELPVDLCFGSVWCTHGTPGNPYHLVDGQGMLPLLRGLPPPYSLLLSGHNHRRWAVSDGERLSVNPGALGMLEEEPPGCVAPYAVLTLSRGRWRAEQRQIRYDEAALRRDFRDSGLADTAPEMAAAVLRQMTKGSGRQVLRLIRTVQSVSEETGCSKDDPAVWHEAGRRWEKES